MSTLQKNSIKVLVLPGAQAPKQGREGDRAFDCYVPWITDGTPDPLFPYRLKRLWDFESPPDPSINHKTELREVEGANQMVYVLKPGDEVMVGLGVIFGMGEWSAEIAPRSSTGRVGIKPYIIGTKLADRKGSVTELPPPYSPVLEMEDILDFFIGVPIDGNFVGEPRTVLKNWGQTDFVISRGRRITQLKFEGPGGAEVPEFEFVHAITAIGETNRSHLCNGSSGTH